jgi:DNA excision repair protein ERCC-1
LQHFEIKILLACVLFLSVRYHTLKPDYINERLKKLGKHYDLRVLLVQVDLKEPHNALKHLTRVCLLTEMTLILAWSAEEAGRIIETYKLYENAPADKIMEKPETDMHSQIINALTSISKVNKTDASNLLTHFGTLENLINAKESQLNACIGLGPRKQEKLLKLFNQNFLKPDLTE